jgi:hypothetical protein
MRLRGLTVKRFFSAIMALVVMVSLVPASAGAIPSDPFFSNPQSITVFDAFEIYDPMVGYMSGPGYANPYQSSVNVSGLTGVVESVTVTLHNVSHQDLDGFWIAVETPHGNGIGDGTHVADVMGHVTATDATFSFSSTSTDVLPMFGAITGGTYAMSTWFENEVVDQDPNGSWSLILSDQVAGSGYSGTVAGGWSVTFKMKQPDAVKPVVSVPGDMTVEATGPAGAVVTYTATANDDVDGDLAPICNVPSGSTFPLGETTVTCSATDAASNAGDASFKVTVQDTTKPTLNVPTNASIEAIGAAGATYTYSVSANDAVSGDLTAVVSCSYPSGSVLPLGTTNLGCWVMDGAGNQQISFWDVEVTDTVAPTVSQPEFISLPGRAKGGLVPVFVIWNGSDAVSMPHYQIQVRVDGGAWQWRSSIPGMAIRPLSLPVGKSWQARVRATDGHGNRSAWATSAVMNTQVIEQNDSAVVYSGTWAKVKSTPSINGSFSKSQESGATATVSFTGSTITWVAPRGAARGVAQVYINGHHLGAIDLYAATSVGPETVFSYSGLNPTDTHELRIEVTGTGNISAVGTSVIVDHFIVGSLQP